MADFNSLEKKIEELSHMMMQGFASLKTELKADIAELTQATATGFVRVEERLETLDEKATIAEEKLERIERNQLIQKEDMLSLDTRVTTLEHPVG